MSLPLARYAVLAAIAVVMAVLVAALRVIGSPSGAREVRLDERRVDALDEISRAVDVYFVEHARLPADLTALRQVSSARIHDPETGRPFEYLPRGDKGYELCATFSRESQHERAAFWWHSAGRRCYKLTVREPRPRYPDR